MHIFENLVLNPHKLSLKKNKTYVASILIFYNTNLI